MSDTVPASRQRILDVATRLFGQHGYAATSVRAVVEGAGITKPTLYYYFSNKRGLFLAVLEAQVARIRAILADVRDSSDPPSERLRTFVELQLQQASRHVDGCRLLLEAKLPRDGDDPDVDLLSLTRESYDVLVGIFEDGQNTGAFAEDLPLMSAALGVLGTIHFHVAAVVHGATLDATNISDATRLILQGVTRR